MEESMSPEASSDVLMGLWASRPHMDQIQDHQETCRSREKKAGNVWRIDKKFSELLCTKMTKLQKRWMSNRKFFALKTCHLINQIKIKFRFVQPKIEQPSTDLWSPSDLWPVNPSQSHSIICRSYWELWFPLCTCLSVLSTQFNLSLSLSACLSLHLSVSVSLPVWPGSIFTSCFWCFLPVSLPPRLSASTCLSF